MFLLSVYKRVRHQNSKNAPYIGKQTTLQKQKRDLSVLSYLRTQTLKSLMKENNITKNKHFSASYVQKRQNA